MANCVPAPTHAVSGQALRYKTGWLDFSDGLQGDQDDRVLQRCRAVGLHGGGHALSGVATGAEGYLEAC